MRQIERRLRLLEIAANPPLKTVTLHFEDGDTREIRGEEDFVLHLFSQVWNTLDPNSEDAISLELIRRSVLHKNDDALLSLTRALLNTPLEPAFTPISAVQNGAPSLLISVGDYEVIES